MHRVQGAWNWLLLFYRIFRGRSKQTYGKDQIQKIDESRIEIVGSYRLNSMQKENKSIENNVLYFVGSGLYHSYEIEILMNLSLFLQDNFNGDFNIIYRPHPYHLTMDRLHYLTTQLVNFKNITIER